MHEPAYELLNAYLDGELSVSARRSIEHHLAICPLCRQELEQLRSLSRLLRTTPLPDFPPAGHFVVGLTRHLRSHVRLLSQPPRTSLVAWLAPVGLLTVWFLVHALTILGNLLDLAGGAGVLRISIPALIDQGQSLWLMLAQLLAGNQLGQVQPWLAALDSLTRWSADLQGTWMIQAGIVTAYWLWIILSQRRPTSPSLQISSSG